MHIGNLIRQTLKERGYTVVWFAAQLAYTRVNVYKIFEKKSLDTDLLMRISVILDTNFFKPYHDEFEDSQTREPNWIIPFLLESVSNHITC